ncbi:MAG: carboxylesterase family protein [Nitrospira sp. CG24D]|nr:MAG: carboxylesterase family protein [Nitrospira sp. CG24D]
MRNFSADIRRRWNQFPFMLGWIILLCAGLNSCAKNPPIVLSTPSSVELTHSIPTTFSGRIVKTESGEIEGVVSGDVLSFKGIPYATPPVGDRRWRAPESPAAWTGVRKAIAFGHDCMQVRETSAFILTNSTPSEDCLVLNIWRPARVTGEKPLPVMVWIHGGAYITGGSSNPLYDGSAFARQNMIFVSLNYRLGRFGFFAHPALLSANEGPVGNYAYMDQLAALQWVQRNIAAFGGEPNQVTLAGESAGGDAVLHLLTSPRSSGLFHRAIIMSGGGRTPLLGDIPLAGGTARRPSADQIGIHFADAAGITGSGPEALHDLRNLSADKVRGNLSVTHLVDTSSKLPTYVRGAIIDGIIVSAPPGELLSRGQATAVPLMIGTTCRELVGAPPPSKDHPFSYFGSDAKKARAAYVRDGLIEADELYGAISRDMTMQEPARFVAKQNTRAEKHTWLYRFCYVAQSFHPKGFHAGHGSELPFAFNRLVDRYGEDTTDTDRTTAKTFNTYLANFVKTGNPNGSTVPAWIAFDPAQSMLMMFTQNHGPVTMPDPWKERLDLVEHVADGTSPNSGKHRPY